MIIWDRIQEIGGVEEHSISYGKKNVVREKSYEFAKRIVECSRSLRSEQEYDLARQLFRSGTSIGANVLEASAGTTRKDFSHKMSIASKRNS